MSGVGDPRPLTHVHVVVPANDEAARLPRALRCLGRAVAELCRVRPELSARVTLVLDDCVDDSARVAARHRGVTAVPVAYRRVGAARAHGVAVATVGVPAASRDHHWVASTDADCAVPRDWLVRQVAMADTGVDLVTGTVEPDEELDAATRARWRIRHLLGDGHPHVHGANLGVRLTAYDAAGGFDPVELHEDVALVERVRASGATCLATASIHVRTSGRTVGRTPGGFAGYLEDLCEPHPLTG